MKIFKSVSVALFVFGITLSSFASPLSTAELSIELQGRIDRSYNPVHEVKIVREMELETCYKQDIRLKTEDLFRKESVVYSLEVYYPYDKIMHEDQKIIGNLIVLPTIMGVSPLEQNFAKNACRRGFKTVILGSWTGDDIETLDIGIHDIQATKALNGIRKVLDYLQAPAQIVGTSLGSLYSSAALAIEPRITAGVLIVAGADIPSIMTYSQEKSIKALREKRCELYKLKTDEEYLTFLRENVHFSPEVFINETAKQKKLMMVIALGDHKVPSKYQQELVEHWQPDLVIEKTHGHVRSVIDTFLFDQSEIFQFLKKNL